MTSKVVRGAVYAALAVVAWFAVRRDAPPAPKPAELFEEEDATRAVSSTRPDTLGRGETLDILLRRGGLDGPNVLQVVNAAASLNPRRLRPGLPVEFIAESDTSAPHEIVFRLDLSDPERSRILRLTRGPDGTWTSTEERLPWFVDTVTVRGVVQTSLHDALSTVAAELFPGRSRDELIEEIASVFDHRVDWFRDLRVGDSIVVLAERSRGPESRTRPGRVLAAKLTVGGRMFEAFCFPADPGAPSCRKYYDSEGKSLATMFLRAPFSVRQPVTSGFGRRFHPILKISRPHNGADYGAPPGTPVRTVGDGVIQRAVYNPGGYGNVVDIRHPNGYVTRYAHLSRFGAGIRSGKRVLQGDIIGYVGSTGLATGPHLHFEVLIGGSARNPSTAFARVDGTPLPESDRPRFARLRDMMLAMLGQSEGIVRYAETP